MLVLTRKREQKIIIGDGITITILGIQTNQVRLGIEAPSNIPILREELSRRPAQEPAAPRMTEVTLNLEKFELAGLVD